MFSVPNRIVSVMLLMLGCLAAGFPQHTTAGDDAPHATDEIDEIDAGVSVARALVAESVARVEVGELDQARNLARRALAIDPDNSDARVVLGTYGTSVFEIREQHLQRALRTGGLLHFTSSEVLRQYVLAKFERGQFGDVASLLKDRGLDNHEDFSGIFAVAYALSGPAWDGGMLLDRVRRTTPFQTPSIVYYWLREDRLSVRFFHWLVQHGADDPSYLPLFVHATRLAPMSLKPQLAEQYYDLGGQHPLPAALAILAREESTTTPSPGSSQVNPSQWSDLLNRLKAYEDATAVKVLSETEVDLGRLRTGVHVLKEDSELFGVPAAWYVFSHGRLDRWVLDRDRGGRVDVGVAYTEGGSPRALYLRTERYQWDIEYLSYPAVLRVSVREKDGNWVAGTPIDPVTVHLPEHFRVVPQDFPQSISYRLALTSQELDAVSDQLQHVWATTALSKRAGRASSEGWLWRIPVVP